MAAYGEDLRLVPQPLVVRDEFADRFWELVTLPPALTSPCGLALTLRRGKDVRPIAWRGRGSSG